MLFAGAACILILLGIVYCCCYCKSDDDADDFNEGKLKEEEAQLDYDGSMVQIICENSRVENLDIYANERKEGTSPTKS